MWAIKVCLKVKGRREKGRIEATGEEGPDVLGNKQIQEHLTTLTKA
jgi:hypothetical protein